METTASLESPRYESWCIQRETLLVSLIGLFLAGQFVALNGQYFESLSQSYTVYVKISRYGSLIPLFLAAFLSIDWGRGSYFVSRFNRGVMLWVAAVFVCATVSMFLGWSLRGYAFEEALKDYAPYLVILSCILTCSDEKLLSRLEPLLLLIFIGSLVLNFLGMLDIGNLLMFSASMEERVARDLTSYRIQSSLSLWPLLLIMSFLKPLRLRNLLVYVGVVFVLVQQILFQKRAPTIRIILFLLAVFLVIPYLRRKYWCNQEVLRKRWDRLVALVLTLVLLGTAVLALRIDVLSAQGHALMLRYLGKSDAEQYKRKTVLDVLILENDRIQEAKYFIDDLSSWEILIGKGMGGFYTLPTEEGQWLADIEQVGRRELHMGVLMPFFKGGVILFVVFYIWILILFTYWKRARYDPATSAAYLILSVWAIFLFTEGSFILSNSFDLFNVGTSIGILSRRIL